MTEVTKINTVMTIDDDSVTQFLYKRIIERSGIVENIVSYQMAEDALNHLKCKNYKKIDLIFLDINMPRMNGFEFLENAIKDIGDDFANTVVMLTTSFDPTDQKRASSFKMVKAYLNKPLTEDYVRSSAELALTVWPENSNKYS